MALSVLVTLAVSSALNNWILQRIYCWIAVVNDIIIIIHFEEFTFKI